MLKGREIALGIAIASAVWVILIALNLDSSALYQIGCDANNDQNGCPAHHLPYVLLWWAGYVLNPSTITAAATAAIGYFTYTLYTTSAEQARLTRESIDLARKEFISTHRPKLRIRRIFPLAPFAENEVPRLRLLAANIGDTKASIIEYGWEIYTDRDYTPAATPIPRGAWEVPAGKQISIDFTGATVLDFVTASNARDGWIYIVGVINYADDEGVVRTTAFARRFSSDRGRFVPLDDDQKESDREYEN